MQHAVPEHAVAQEPHFALLVHLGESRGLEQIVDRNDLDVVIFQRKVIEVAADLSQAHNADPDFAVTHLAISLFPRLNSKEGLILDPLLLKKQKSFGTISKRLKRFPVSSLT